MDLDEYQRGALRTAAPRDKRNELLHLLFVLVRQKRIESLQGRDAVMSEVGRVRAVMQGEVRRA